MKTKPIGVFLIGLFLLLGVSMLLLSSITFLIPGTFLDEMWKVNPDGYKQMMPYRQYLAVAFIALGMFFIVTDIGWFKRKKWAWYFTVGIFITNGIGDIGRMIGGDIPGGVFGIVVAGLIIYYLTRKQVRDLFS